MAQIRSNGDTVVVCTGSSMFVFRKPGETFSSASSVAEADLVLRLVDFSSRLPPLLIKNGAGDEQDTIINSAFSRGGKLFAVVSSEKVLLVFDSSFSLLVAHRLPKSPTAVVFDHTADYAVVADRAGSVTRYPLKNASKILSTHDINGVESASSGQPLTGTISMVLDVALSPCGRFLLSADRDEKLRVSRYPQAFVIHSFCLGHTEYVGSIACREKVVFSGDRRVKSWRIEDGSCIATSEPMHPKKPIRRIRILPTSMGVVVAALIEGTSTVKLLDEELREKGNLEGGDEPFVDIQPVRPGHLFALSKEAITVFDLDEKKKWTVTAGGDALRRELATTSDALTQLFKNVAFNNVDEYQKRKEDRKRKIAEAKEERLTKAKPPLPDPPGHS